MSSCCLELEWSVSLGKSMPVPPIGPDNTLMKLGGIINGPTREKEFAADVPSRRFLDIFPCNSLATSCKS